MTEEHTRQVIELFEPDRQTWGIENDRPCRRCGHTWEEHDALPDTGLLHCVVQRPTYEPEPVLPQGCKCLPDEWRHPVIPVCEEYVQDTYTESVDLCNYCRHRLSCHQKKEVAE